MKIKVIYSDKDNKLQPLEYKYSKSKTGNVKIDLTKIRQTMMGFGGALTPASAYVYKQMDDKTKHELLNALYAPKGLNYNLGRVCIGSCDFSTSTYDYLLSDGSYDYSIENTNLFPFLDDVYKLKKISLIAAPWTPPKVYKDNNDYLHGGRLKDDCYQKYAKYLVSYVSMMKQRGYHLDYLTMQNEPEAKQTWESCLYSPEQENKLLLLVHEELKNCRVNDIKLYLFDHNRDTILNRATTSFKDKKVRAIVDGIAYHFYDRDKFKELSKVKNRFKEKNLLFTEGCIELLCLDSNNPTSQIGKFKNGLVYAINYLNDCNNYSNGFIDWNVLLDNNGGPNHVGNYCEAPIMYDLDNKKLIFNASYYVIYHFAHFIKPEAKFIKIRNQKNNFLISGFINPDNSIVIICLNLDLKKRNINIGIESQNIHLCLKPCSISTMVINK